MVKLIDLMRDERFEIVEKCRGGERAILIFLKMLLLSKKYKTDKLIIGGTACDVFILAKLFDKKKREVKRAVKLLSKCGLCEVSDGCIRLCFKPCKSEDALFAKECESTRKRSEKRHAKEKESIKESIRAADITNANVTEKSKVYKEKENEKENEKEKRTKKEIDKEKEKEKEKDLLFLSVSTEGAQNKDGTDKMDKTDKTDRDRESEIKKEGCPSEYIVQLYNRICPELSPVYTVNKKRRSALEALWSKYPDRAMFEKLFMTANESTFLKGRNERGWKADFDWLIKAGNFEKVIERKYEDHTAPSIKNDNSSFDINDFVNAAIAKSTSQMEASAIKLADGTLI